MFVTISKGAQNLRHYTSFNDDMLRRFGSKVYKLSLDGGMTCPNRDGTVGHSGCSFCSMGSGAFSSKSGGDIAAQIEAAKALVRHKNPGGKYIAYFQSYTNTYAPVEALRRLFYAAMEPEDIVGLAIGTRPDCLGEDVLALLSELNGRKPVWVELGLQTVHEATAAAIRRGYTLDVYDDAMRRLTQAGLETVVHVILGLPGESREMILETVSYVAHSGAAGIKLQLLHVLEGTDMARDFLAGRFETLGMEEYVSILCDAVRLLRPDMVVHRLTGDGAKRELIAPLWSADKKRVLSAINAAFEANQVLQGSRYIP